MIRTLIYVYLPSTTIQKTNRSPSPIFLFYFYNQSRAKPYYVLLREIGLKGY